MTYLKPRPRATGIRAVLFDVDGTLVDTADLIADSLAFACGRFLGREYPRETYLGLIGRPVVAQMKTLGAGERLDEMVEAAIEYYERHAGREREFPGVLDTLARLAEHDVRLALVTSKQRRELEPTLERIPLQKYVYTIVTADDTLRPKPYPDPIYRALQLVEAPATQALFVGDSPYDMAAGRAAGVATAAALWGPHPRERLEPEAPTYWLERIEEALSLVMATWEA